MRDGSAQAISRWSSLAACSHSRLSPRGGGARQDLENLSEAQVRRNRAMNSMYPSAWHLRRDIREERWRCEKTGRWIVNRSGQSLGMGVESRSAAGGSGGRSTVRVASGEAGDMAAWRNLKTALTAAVLGRSAPVPRPPLSSVAPLGRFVDFTHCRSEKGEIFFDG